MRRNGRPHRAWQRHEPKPDELDAQHVLEELHRRVLSDLESCRFAWEQDGDPLAVCTAVLYCHLPPWLEQALLVHLTDEVFFQRPSIRKIGWRGIQRDKVDRLRAMWVAAGRSHDRAPQTWESALTVAKLAIGNEQYSDVRHVDESAIEKSYHRVRRGLRRPGRYFVPPADLEIKVKDAWSAVLTSMKQWVENNRAAARTSSRRSRKVRN